MKTSILKKVSLLIIVLFFFERINAQVTGIGLGINMPDASSIFDATATDKGILIPRVALTAANLAGPITLPQNSLLVYNTATVNTGAGLPPNNLSPGYYYNSGTTVAPLWKKLAIGNIAWETTGNYGTTAAANFLGPIDANDLVIKTNNLETGRFLSNTLTGPGIVTPTDRFRITREGTSGTKWPMTASFQLGSYATGVNAQTQMDIALGNGGVSVPEVKVMTLLGNGNVGIGATAPPNKLQLQDNSGSTGNGIGFSTNGGTTPTQARIKAIDNNWSADLLFETSVPGSGAGAITERMRLKNTGDLQMTGSQGRLWLETNGWADPGTTGAGIAVDNNTYKSLMIVGNNVASNLGQNRQVQVWDYLKVNGYVTVGTQASATGTLPPSGTMRYNTTRNCMEYFDGTYWICMGPPTVQRITVRDQNDENYQGSGCNACTGWGGSYGAQYSFTVNNLYAGQKIMFYAEILFDNDTKKNGGYLNATKISGNGYWGEIEVTVPGSWETVQTKVFPAVQINATGNLTFVFESNTGITDVRITAVAY